MKRPSVKYKSSTYRYQINQNKLGSYTTYPFELPYYGDSIRLII